MKNTRHISNLNYNIRDYISIKKSRCGVTIKKKQKGVRSPPTVANQKIMLKIENQ